MTFVFRIFFVSAFLLQAWLWPLAAQAACSSPAGVSGQMGYGITGLGRYQYCNDTNWLSLYDDFYGPIAHLKFDETSGATAFDSVGGYNATLNNTPTWQTTGGQIGGAVSFSLASDEYAHFIGGVPAPVPFTISFWLRPTSTSSNYAAVLTETDSTGFWFDPSSDILKMYVNDTELLTSTTSITNGTWTHITMTDDGTTSRLYINGVEEDTSASRVNFTILRIAGGFWGVSYFFDGRIDDLRAYNRTLTAAEVSALYGMTLPDYTCVKEKAFGYVGTYNYMTVCRDGLLRYLERGATGAACTGAGKLEYGSNTYRYCNGSNWIPAVAGQITEPTSNLTHKWMLNESAGTTADDAVGASDGTLANGAAWQTAGGKINGALQFDGVDDIASIPSVALSTPFSLTFWMKRTVDIDGNYMAIITQSNDTGVWHDQNATAVSVFITNNEWLAGGSVATNVWTHVAITDDGATSRLYVNGMEVDNDSNRVGFTINALADSFTGGSDEPYQGLLDDVRTYSVVLTPTQIENLYLSTP